MNLNTIITSVNPKGNLGVKDIFLTKNIKTTAASKVLKDYLPQYSSTIVERLLNSKSYILNSKLNCDAWAHGTSGENSDFGPVKNPYNPNYTPGGSSSGSAAAVASEEVKVALGTDTGGSIRLPASFCNVVGLKPTYGALSRYGVIAMSSSLDCPGIFAHTVSQIEKTFHQASGRDLHDATSQTKTLNSKLKTLNSIRIGLPEEYFSDGINPEIKQAVKTAAQLLKKQGIKLIKIKLPNTKYSVAVYYLIQTAEVSSNLARYDGIRYGQSRRHFSPEAKRRIMLGTFALSSGYVDEYYIKAAKVRTMIINDFQKAFQKVDLMLAPVSPILPFKLNEKINDPLSLYLLDALTIPANLAGLPAMAVPCGFSKNKLPIGMQLIAPQWHEALIFQLGKLYQSLTNWHLQKPSL